MSGRTLWSYRKNSADLDLLKSDRPLVYSSKMAEEIPGRLTGVAVPVHAHQRRVITRSV
jgi:hypothetical protein